MQQIVGGLLAYCFSLITHGPIKSWQALFITYGCFSSLWGAFVLWWMPDSPMRAKCFSPEDRLLMAERVRKNETGIQNKEFKVRRNGVLTFRQGLLSSAVVPSTRGIYGSHRS